MERFCALRTIHFMRKNADRNAMAPCVCCMLPVSVIAVNVNCVQIFIALSPFFLLPQKRLFIFQLCNLVAHPVGC